MTLIEYPLSLVMLLLSGDQISNQFKYSVKNFDIIKLRVKNSQKTFF